MKSNKNKIQNANAFVQRLPFHQQLSQSQLLLGKLAPLWSQWTKKNLTVEINNCISPKYFHNGKLGIECTNAVAATQIQQRQQTLLDYLHQNGLTQIQHFTVRITHNMSDHSKNTTTNSTDSFTQLNLNHDAIVDSIKSCQQNIKHQPLSESLNRLIKTLQQPK